MNQASDVVRRRVLASLAGGALSAVLPLRTLAQSTAYPRKPITLVVPFPPGGTVDAMSRQVAEAVGVKLGQPVVVENRPGAATLLATQQVARAPADGYTLLITTTALAINAVAHPKPNYDPLSSFVPVAHMINTPALWIGRTALPGKDVREVLNAYRAQPGKLSVGTWGPASSVDIYAAMIQDTSKVQLTRVPYKGEAPAMMDVMSGTIDTAFVTVANYRAQVTSGRIRPLAVCGPQRHPLVPDVPTFAEVGIPGPSLAGYVGIVAPAGTPQAIVDRFATAVQEVMRTPQFAKRVESDWAFQLVAAGPADFGKTIARDLPRWERTVRDFHIRME